MKNIKITIFKRPLGLNPLKVSAFGDHREGILTRDIHIKDPPMSLCEMCEIDSPCIILQT